MDYLQDIEDKIALSKELKSFKRTPHPPTKKNRKPNKMTPKRWDKYGKGMSGR